MSLSRARWWCGSFLLAVLGSAVCLPASRTVSAQTAVPLRPGVPVEREIDGGRSDTYHLSLRQDELAVIVLESRGIDLALEVSAPDGALLIETDDEIAGGGDEQLELVAERAGVHVLSVWSRVGRAARGSYRLRIADLRSADERDRLLHESRKHRTASRQHLRASRFEPALSEGRRALEIAEAAGADELYLARLRWLVGVTLYENADYEAARTMLAQSFDRLSERLGGDHPHVIRLQTVLGTVHTSLGDLATSERLLRDALARAEARFGLDDVRLVPPLRSLGVLESARSDFAEAERAFLRAQALVEKWNRTDHETYGMLDNNLGIIYMRQRDYARAEVHLRRGLEAQEQAYGPGHSRLATPLQNLGIIAREKGDYAAAEQYYRRALEIRERTVGLDHPIVAGTINNLANVYGAQGKYAESLALHLRALAISEKHATPWQYPVLSLGNIARTYAAMGDFENALAYQERVDTALDADMTLNLAIGSERQKLAYLRNTAERTERTISLHLQLQPDNPAAARLAARALLRRKARVVDAMIDTLGSIRRNALPEDRARLEELSAVVTKFATLALRGPGGMSSEEYRLNLQSLNDRKEQLERELNRRSEAFRVASLPVTLEAVENAVPTDAALLEFAVYRPFDPRSRSTSVAYGSPRYAVYVIRPGRSAGYDLGEAAPIDAAIEAFRAALQDPSRGDVKTVARALDELVVRPIREAVADVERLLVSPDGQLALIPFEALVAEDGRYLIDRHAVSYMTAGRDLLRMQAARPAAAAPLVLADPLFGDDDAAAGSDSPAVARRSVTSAADLKSLYFAPLAGTREEARRIQSIFSDTRVLTGRAATEQALKDAHAPRILHIATHGFFIESRPAPADTRSPVTDAPASAAANPLLRSGLALAGANAPGPAEDGILTALEAAHLNLWGTKLVTLSACDTGIGVVRNGEGVYGLRRSIFLAGAETLVMSLWPVSDYITREMMTAYYQNLRDGMGRGEALRQVQRAMLARSERAHPFYWASFVQAGEWANLDGRR